MLTKHVWRSLETRSNHQLNLWNGSLPLWTDRKLTWTVLCSRSNAWQVWGSWLGTLRVNWSGACNRKLEVPLGAIEAEAKAVKLGLMFARDLSIQDFTLESDSLTLINALQDLSPPPSSVAALAFSSVAMSHSFICVDFSHVVVMAIGQPIYLQNML